MSNALIILIILFVTVGMVGFGIALNRILGLKKEEMKNIREKALNLQERMRNAQVLGDPQLMIQIQRETVQLTNQMMKKQLLPMCLRCIIFLGIFIVLSLIFAKYDSGLLPFPLWIFGSGWFAIYIIFSLSLSLLIYGIRRLYKKVIQKEPRTQSYFKEILGILSPTQGMSGITFQTDSELGIQDQSYEKAEEFHSVEKKDLWKDRIEK
jgi:uncharacterized membrane protein (DUF106 family)